MMNVVDAREARIMPRRFEYYTRGRNIVRHPNGEYGWLADDSGTLNRRQPLLWRNTGNAFTVAIDPAWLQPERLSRLESLTWRLDQRRQRFWITRETALCAELIRVGGIADWRSPDGDTMRYFFSEDSVRGSGGSFLDSSWLGDDRPWIPGARNVLIEPELGSRLRQFMMIDGPMRNAFVLTVADALCEAVRRECTRRWPAKNIFLSQLVRLTINDRAYFYKGTRGGATEEAVNWHLVEWPLFGQWESVVIS